MKTIFLTLVLMLAFGVVFGVQAQGNQTVKVRVTQQKIDGKSKLRIQFVSLQDDSRCPKGTRCIWAGNAQIQVKITDSRTGRSETFTMNTNTGAKGASFAGYAVNLVALDPHPANNIRINRNGYTATFSINKLTR